MRLRIPWQLVVAGLFASLIFGVGPAGAIIRRHDVPDREYVVDADEFPGLVDLLSPGDCMASLVGSRWLLTAAHCAHDVPVDHAIEVAGREHEVAGVVCHPGYSGDKHDLALVRLRKSVRDVQPLPLYRKRDEHGQRVVFVGRGDTATGSGGQREASLDFQTRQATNIVARTSQAWLEFVFDEPGSPGSTPLEGISGDGDSGGPALIDVDGELHIAGISSWQDARRRKLGKYGVHEFYARVSSYGDFLDETLDPDWEGEFRACPAEGCSMHAWRGGTPAHAAPLFLLALALCRRRKRRMPRGSVSQARA